MEILTKALGALWQVALVGVLLGAGLPALFAFGIRALSGNQVATASGGSEHTETTVATPAGRVLAYLCFGTCVLAVLFGIIVIVFGNQIFGK